MIYDYILISFVIKAQKFCMTAIDKITAAKLIVLINLPVLLLIAGVYKIGSSVIV